MKLLLFILFVGLTVFGQAQSGKFNPEVNEIKVKVLKFYPNPAVSVINFEFQKAFDKGFVLQVYNFIGKKVSEVSNVSAKTSIPLTDFYRGVYIFQLRDKTGRIVESGKFQIIK